ncbi:MAG: single-stranded DNA-binding protein [Candidatus Omnitrophica bacterium]|nr:single-stranded DNA-binding protein [Candidatus Omnitrophota bacterium]
MSLEINSVVIGGNLARDVVLREIANGSKVASLVVASNRTFISNGEKKKEVAFIDVDVWGASAENCNQYLSKGSPVVVTGRLKQEQWQTENGEKRSRMKVVAANVQFLPSSNRGQNQAVAAKEPSGWE